LTSIEYSDRTGRNSFFGRLAFWTVIQPQKWFINSPSPDLLSRDEETPNSLRRYFVRFVCVVLFLSLAFFPNRKITPVLQKPFEFTVDQNLTAGRIYSFAATESQQLISFGSKKPLLLSDKKLYFMTVPAQAPKVQFYILYKKVQRHFMDFLISPFLSAAPLSFSSEIVSITFPQNQQSKMANNRLPSAIPPTEPRESLENIQLSKLLERTDGPAHVNCWSAPILNPTPGLALRAHGPGETVMAQETAGFGKSVVIYHGGGIFTRYMHLREIQTHVGEKIGEGQIIGFAGSAHRQVNPTFWEVSWNETPLNPADFLSFSQKFCEATKSLTAKKNSFPGSSIAMKLFTRMTHRHHQ
jgi:hypothetical protein